MEIKKDRKIFVIYKSPYVENPEEVIQDLLQYVVDKMQEGNSDFYGYRNVKNKLDELGYYTDL